MRVGAGRVAGRLETHHDRLQVGLNGQSLGISIISQLRDHLPGAAERGIQGAGGEQRAALQWLDPGTAAVALASSSWGHSSRESINGRNGVPSRHARSSGDRRRPGRAVPSRPGERSLPGGRPHPSASVTRPVRNPGKSGMVVAG